MTSRRRRGERRVTIEDVARAAGVSSATVSFVVNDKPGVRLTDGTKERVWRAVEELGYRPNAMAQTLSRGRSSFIGLVADAIATTPFAGQIIRGAQDEAWRHGYVLLVANTEGVGDVEANALAMMHEHRVTGVLYSTWYHRKVEPPAGLGELSHVLVDCYADDPDVPAVVPDEVQGGRLATTVLLDRGHRRIAFITSTEPAPATFGRLAGYEGALTDRGLTLDPDLVVAVHPEQEGGYTAAATLLDRPDPPTAVFCYNDRVAMGLYDALRERGLSVPGDVAVVGFDNQEVIAGHLRPPLSTVALPHYELGVEGVRMLLALRAGELEPPMRRLITCPPVMRSSV
ncbi:LacI family DNA-binding transcriptional regulator [Jiangella anatolica]|uniref:LacI family transcriptional regulator n=1 Tax=Jiangella anatolica TaxID=2670374 RepID=A0A2W2BJV6_9ACTN|nr:LacI family DNA-binding transcriptional regulator [Jiangella anatolica]PZF86292.1 LacI family transcriptional regulator [Jiangella anatolica]